ncbi:hypothetical protein EVA_03775 [gut metagenome]|uniref:Uncharacterized protein n=1 Tax=gut metagenome TaxID=749906 RepID=J9H3B4_9ZZZZ
MYIGISVYFIEYKYHRFSGCANISQRLVHNFYLFFKIRMRDIHHVQQ